ncbi:MAG TPA: hypothetical protein VFP26_00895 [Gemmatimonadaceae bacterium]|nr:hypothetical protein [Gemmatimonadaceae bacterium]
MLKPLITLATFAALVACGSDKVAAPPPPPPGPQSTVYTATGDIAAAVDQFRNLLGPANTVAGEQPTGRREITWDGAGANPFDNQNNFPADFFNTNVKAGAIFTTSGTGFRNDSTDFAEINPSYAAQFTFFSAKKIFAPVGSNQLDQLFQVAGQPTPAVSRGFGIVFSDVDVADKTTIQLFARDGSSLGTFPAPVRSDAAGLSFLGVTFTDAVIARVRITLGTGAMGPGVNDITSGGTVDLVVLDNLIYGEPKQAF